MIYLFDYYTQETKDLYDSLKHAGMSYPTVVIHDDGFLPKTTLSPYTYLLGEESGKPLYFNQVPVPKYWEIKGNSSQAEIYNLDSKRGIIRFGNPGYKRLVKTVEWLNRSGQVMSVDHYNQYGRRFAQTIYTTEQEAFSTTYYHVDGREIVIENHLTEDIILHTRKGIRIFQTKEEFIHYMIADLQLDTTSLVYNSLSTPFFVSYTLERQGQDFLFWQESIDDEIPGNMKLLFNNPHRQTKIVVQDKEVYERLRQLLSPEQLDRVTYLGLIYEMKRQNQRQARLLNFTNSDEILHLETLIQKLPEFQFYIAALTEMSPRLLAMAEYPNVILYPNVSPKNIDKLLNSCDIYLDINYGNEILSATRQAFEHEMLLLGFADTLHTKQFIAKEHIIDNDSGAMVELLRRLYGTPQEISTALEKQYEEAQLSSTIDYQVLFGSRV